MTDNSAGTISDAAHRHANLTQDPVFRPISGSHSTPFDAPFSSFLCGNGHVLKAIPGAAGTHLIFGDAVGLGLQALALPHVQHDDIGR